MQGSGIWVRAWVFVRVKGSGPVLDLECFRTASGSKLQDSGALAGVLEKLTECCCITGCVFILQRQSEVFRV